HMAFLDRCRYESVRSSRPRMQAKPASISDTQLNPIPSHGPANGGDGAAPERRSPSYDRDKDSVHVGSCAGRGSMAPIAPPADVAAAKRPIAVTTTMVARRPAVPSANAPTAAMTSVATTMTTVGARASAADHPPAPGFEPPASRPM